MKHTAVDSSNIASVAHAGHTLEVKFKSGDLYEYDNVPASVYQSLLNAPSVGGYLHQHIKGKYPYRKVA